MKKDKIRSGVIVLAAGMGQRLNYSKPKGCFPITPFKKKSLFQLVCEKIKAISKILEAPFDVAFFVSKQNQKETENFFSENCYFGLEKSQLSFFVSEEMPLLNLEGLPLLESAPNGNGSVFKAFKDSCLLDSWKQKGITHITVISIDNPLARPYDEALLEIAIANEVTLVATNPKDRNEKVGRIIKREGKVEVIEYGSEERESDFFANAGIYVFSLPFMEKAAMLKLPLHPILKGGKIKNEQFIFDCLPEANKSDFFFIPREHCFAPLKNFEGPDSIEEVVNRLQTFDRNVFYQISGVMPDHLFELSADFYYPTEELKNKWRGKSSDSRTYIEA